MTTYGDDTFFGTDFIPYAPTITTTWSHHYVDPDIADIVDTGKPDEDDVFVNLMGYEPRAATDVEPSYHFPGYAMDPYMADDPIDSDAGEEEEEEEEEEGEKEEEEAKAEEEEKKEAEDAMDGDDYYDDHPPRDYDDYDIPAGDQVTYQSVDFDEMPLVDGPQYENGTDDMYADVGGVPPTDTIPADGIHGSVPIHFPEMGAIIDRALHDIAVDMQRQVTLHSAIMKAATIPKPAPPPAAPIARRLSGRWMNCSPPVTRQRINVEKSQAVTRPITRQIAKAPRSSPMSTYIKRAAFVVLTPEELAKTPAVPAFHAHFKLNKPSKVMVATDPRRAVNYEYRGQNPR